MDTPCYLISIKSYGGWDILAYFPFTKAIERPKMAYYHNKLYDALNISVFSKTYVASLWCLAQAWHTHDVASKSHDETTTSIELDIFDVDLEALNAAIALSVCAE